jgi:predicted ATPase/DNA-binding SARP family transcriptional activator
MQPLHLYLRLLGTPEVKAGATSFSFSLERRYQLLAYLAHAGEWVSRDQLAYLFWPDHSDKAARSNVRKALFNARKLSWLEGLEQTPSALRWDIKTDVKEFQAALNEENFEAALELYHGPFLQGMELKAEGEFASWLELERQRLHGLFRTAVFNHAGALSARGESREAVKALQHFLEHDAIDEEAVQKLLTLFNDLADVAEGTRVYRMFTSTLERELGLEPNIATQHLFETLQKPQTQMPRTESVTPSTPVVAAPSSSFIGRTLELQELSDLLAQADCRLLTLLGPGGVGKTRVALHLTKSMTEKFSDGVQVILLEALNTPELMVSKIIEALGINLQNARDPLEYLKCYLAEKHLLLVLDNFEHLVSGASLLSELLTACPQLKLLVTSRERLHLEQEWLLPLEGLNYPQNVKVRLEEALTYDAIQLFVARAKRLQPHFTATQADVKHLVEICRLVDGFPLGLELAVTWVRHLPLAGIAREIERNLDFLESGNRDAKGRQQSIRATFEYSWKLLSPKEQEALRKLSVFRGGFTREAAEYVTGTSLPLLSSLIDKSLLRVSTTGRYDQHPLLYQFSQQKLFARPQEKGLLHLKHEEYFFRLLEEQSKDYKSEHQKRALETIREEQENLQLAWQHALANKRFPQLERAAMPLAYYYQIRGPWQEGLKVFTEALEVFKNADRLPRSQAAEGEILSGQTMLHCCVGKFAEAITSAQRGLELLRQASKEDRTLFCLNILGIVYYDTGQYALAEQHFKQALVVAKKVRDKPRTEAIMGNLAIVEVETGHLLNAEKHYRELIELHRSEKNYDSLASVSSDLGDLLRITHRLEEAEKVLVEGVSLAEELGLGYVVPTLLVSLGRTYLELKAYEQARAVLSRALVKSREIGSLRLEAESLYELGTLALRGGDAKEAQEHFRQALHISLETETTPNLLSIVTRYAELEAQRGQVKLAVSWLGFILAHPVTRQSDREKARRLLKQLKEQVAPDNVNRAREHGQTLELETILEDIS